MNREKTSPIEFMNEVISCIADNSSIIQGKEEEDRLFQAERHLRDIFKKIHAIYEHPRYEDIIKAMSQLAAEELKSGKSTKKISENFLKIGKKVKAACGI